VGLASEQPMHFGESKAKLFPFTYQLGLHKQIHSLSSTVYIVSIAGSYLGGGGFVNTHTHNIVML
jgi:hypothetical protein